MTATKSRFRALVLVAAVFGIGVSLKQAQSRTGIPRQSPAPAFTVDGRIALASLIALSDGHLQKLADSLQLLAATPEARSGDWEQIKGPLGERAQFNAPALLWFALPDGSCRSVQQENAMANLSDRPYFHRVLEGKQVIGDLVVSKSTGKCVAIVAVPVFEPDRSVVGVLGASVYLDRLGERIRQEMDLDSGLIFYSFNRQPLLGMVYDPGLIFADPNQLGPDVRRAFAEMLTRQQGVVTYTFHGRRRSVLYRKSPVTGWWYAFGRLQSV